LLCGHGAARQDSIEGGTQIAPVYGLVVAGTAVVDLAAVDQL